VEVILHSRLFLLLLLLLFLVENFVVSGEKDSGKK
jgi:hypothetical protein